MTLTGPGLRRVGLDHDAPVYDWAVLAFIQHHRGEHDAAREYVTMMRDHMSSAFRPDLDALFAEIEQLTEG
jgi:hypothetical protein